MLGGPRDLIVPPPPAQVEKGPWRASSSILLETVRQLGRRSAFLDSVGQPTASGTSLLSGSRVPTAMQCGPGLVSENTKHQFHMPWLTCKPYTSAHPAMQQGLPVITNCPGVLGGQTSLPSTHEVEVPPAHACLTHCPWASTVDLRARTWSTSQLSSHIIRRCREASRHGIGSLLESVVEFNMSCCFFD